MHDLRLRPAGAEDMEFAFHVRKVAFGGYLQPWDEEAQRQVHRQRYSEQEYRVVEVDGADVGIVALRLGLDALKLNQIFLLPDHQGRGIGAECMARLMDEAESFGVPLRLDVRKANPRALAFYERLGFDRMGESETHFLMRWSSRTREAPPSVQTSSQCNCSGMDK